MVLITSFTLCTIFLQLDLSTGSNQVVLEDDDFCYTATYIDLDQVSLILLDFQLSLKWLYCRNHEINNEIMKFIWFCCLSLWPTIFNCNPGGSPTEPTQSHKSSSPGNLRHAHLGSCQKFYLARFANLFWPHPPWNRALSVEDWSKSWSFDLWRWIWKQKAEVLKEVL